MSCRVVLRKIVLAIESLGPSFLRRYLLFLDERLWDPDSDDRLIVDNVECVAIGSILVRPKYTCDFPA